MVGLLLDCVDVGGSVLLHREALMEDSGAFGDLLSSRSVNLNCLFSAYSRFTMLVGESKSDVM